MHAPKRFKLFAVTAVAVAALGTTAVAQASVAYPPGPSGQGQIIAI